MFRGPGFSTLWKTHKICESLFHTVGVINIPTCTSLPRSWSWSPVYWLCRSMQKALEFGAYLPWVQNSVIQAQYYRVSIGLLSSFISLLFASGLDQVSRNLKNTVKILGCLNIVQKFVQNWPSNMIFGSGATIFWRTSLGPKHIEAMAEVLSCNLLATCLGNLVTFLEGLQPWKETEDFHQFLTSVLSRIQTMKINTWRRAYSCQQSIMKGLWRMKSTKGTLPPLLV